MKRDRLAHSYSGSLEHVPVYTQGETYKDITVTCACGFVHRSTKANCVSAHGRHAVRCAGLAKMEHHICGLPTRKYDAGELAYELRARGWACVPPAGDDAAQIERAARVEAAVMRPTPDPAPYRTGPRALSVCCPTCGADEYAPCVKMSSRPPHVAKLVPHAARWDALLPPEHGSDDRPSTAADA